MEGCKYCELDELVFCFRNRQEAKALKTLRLPVELRPAAERYRSRESDLE